MTFRRRSSLAANPSPTPQEPEQLGMFLRRNSLDGVSENGTKKSTNKGESRIGRIFRRDNHKKSTADCDATVSTSSTNKSATHHSPKWSNNTSMVKAYMSALNKKSSLLRFYSSPDIDVDFEDASTLSAGEWSELVRRFHESAPDIQWKYKTIKEESKICILVDDVIVSGTHTGKPFSLLGKDPVPASGRKFTLDYERYFFTVRDGKIENIEVVSLGSKTGPIGMYDKLSAP